MSDPLFSKYDRRASKFFFISEYWNQMPKHTSPKNIPKLKMNVSDTLLAHFCKVSLAQIAEKLDNFRDVEQHEQQR